MPLKWINPKKQILMAKMCRRSRVCANSKVKRCDNCGSLLVKADRKKEGNETIQFNQVRTSSSSGRYSAGGL